MSERKTLIIDGDTNKVIEVRSGRNYPIGKETWDKFESEFGKKVVWCASNDCYGKPYNVFVLEDVKENK